MKEMAPNTVGKCYLCDRTNTQITWGCGYGPLFKCEVCGRYHATPDFVGRVEMGDIGPEVRAELSAAVREANEDPKVATGETPFLLGLQNYESFARQHRLTVSEKIDKLLLLLAKRSEFPGNEVRLIPELDYPLVDARSGEELLAYLGYLSDSGLLTPEVNSAGADCTLTIPGWQMAQPTLRADVIPNRCFVIMWFDPTMDAAYFEGIEPAIRECGFEPRRMKEIEFNEGITDRILAEIRQARFVVADFTGVRPNVYFEAGFAKGLGREVIWCCNQSDKGKLHFDTKHLNHIMWTDIADLKQRLTDRIRATVIAPAT